MAEVENIPVKLVGRKRRHSEGTPTPAQRVPRQLTRAQRPPKLEYDRESYTEEEANVDVIDAIFEVISMLAALAANGTVLLIIGNALLSYTHTNLGSAAKIGAVGGMLAGPIITIFLSICKAAPGNKIAELFIGFSNDFGDIVLGSLSGFLGTAILRYFGANITGDIDASAAAWAGALGGVIGVWRKDFNAIVTQDHHSTDGF